MEKHHHNYHLRHKIAISGSAVTEVCDPASLKKTEIIGEELAKRNIVTVTGATTGMPYWAAKGAHENGGFVLGYSPAASEREHIKKYRLPVDYHDTILFTGYGYSGRNLFIIKSADAVISICGRIGTLNEFTVAFEEKKPIGVLTGSGGLADELEGIVRKANRGSGMVIYDNDPVRLVERLLKVVEANKKEDMELLDEALAASQEGEG